MDIRSNVISICSGGGGLDIGIELAMPSLRPVCYLEREAFAIAHLVEAIQQGILAEAPVWTDVRTFDGIPWRGLVDGLIGGIPCQPHSLAGRKRGSLDDRDLWSPTRRIIAQARPWFVLIENVGGMLSAGADDVAGAERVWRDLRRLGFAVEAGLFRASEVGAPHERERIFVLGVADAGRQRRQQDARIAFGDEGPDAGRSSQHHHVAERAGSDLVDTAVIGRGEGGAEPAIRSRRDTFAGSGEPMGDAAQHGRRSVAVRQPSADQEDIDAVRAGAGLFPPRPADIDRWRDILARAPELEPAIRRVADGLASNRIDWLRLLGNGVVPLQAGYAIRTLGTRLSERGASGAAELVRMMT